MAMTETGFSPYSCVDVDYENRTLVAVAKSKKKIMVNFLENIPPVSHPIIKQVAQRGNDRSPESQQVF